nr:hypothetical transcript [Hymenolepis microstoma]
MLAAKLTWLFSRIGILVIKNCWDLCPSEISMGKMKYSPTARFALPILSFELTFKFFGGARKLGVSHMCCISSGNTPLSLLCLLVEGK